MLKPILTLVASIAIVLPTAHAEESGSDYYSTQSHNKLLLIQKHKRNLDKNASKAYHSGFSPTGMDIKGWKLTDSKTTDKLNKWCTTRTEEMQEIRDRRDQVGEADLTVCLLYTSPSPRDQRGSRMPSSA